MVFFLNSLIRYLLKGTPINMSFDESSATFRIVSVVLLETNQGLLRIVRRTLDWNLWMRAMLEAFSDPHCIFNIIIYIISLLNKVSLKFLLCSRGLRSP